MKLPGKPESALEQKQLTKLISPSLLRSEFQASCLITCSIGLMAVVLLTSCGGSHKADHTTDQALTALFLEKQSLFNEDIYLAKKNPDLLFVSRGLILSKSYPAPINVNDDSSEYRKVLSSTDWRSFRAILGQLHLGDGLKVSRTGVVYFPVDGVSMSNGDSEKGLAYSETPIDGLVQSLDVRRYDSKTVYKKIKPGWYLYLSFG